MSSFATTAFFEKTYDEAMALAEDAHRYFIDEVSVPRAPATVIDAAESLGSTVAGLRLVARITHVVAWLLEQKAVSMGEISALAAVRQSGPLQDILVCLEAETPDRPHPPRLTSLLERSKRLYTRIARLDELMRQTIH